MIGELWEIEITVETLDGPDTAAQFVVAAIEATGWLWIPQSQSSRAVMLPGEEQAFLRGERPVASSVSLRVETMQERVQLAVDDEIVESVLRQLREAGIKCRGVSVARVLA